MAIELHEMSGLTFDDKKHQYRLNGLELPSVTTLMKPLSEAFYHSIDETILQRAAERGTIVHNAAENYALFGIEDIDPSCAGYFDGFKNWWMKNEPKHPMCEKRFYHKTLMYAGTADLICEIGGLVTVVDYKTSAQVNTMLCRIQLEGYDRALESHGLKVEKRIILHLTKTGEYKEVVFERSAENYQVLSALITIDKYKKKIWRYD